MNYLLAQVSDQKQPPLYNHDIYILKHEIYNYRWNMVRHGSGTPLVPKLVTTILLAARLRFSSSD